MNQEAEALLLQFAVNAHERLCVGIVANSRTLK